MARSRRKNPIAGACAYSDKWFKVLAHRQERQAVKVAIGKGKDRPTSRLFGNPWNGPKDGKVWFGNRYPDIYRK